MDKEESAISNFKKISNFFYSIIFELPFKNYHDLYLTGKLQQMTNSEKIQLIVEMNKETQHRSFFNRMLKIRPTFLDDEDLSELKYFEQKIYNLRKVVFIGLFLNWNYFVYNFWVNKQYKLKSLIGGNLIIFSIYIYSKKLCDRHYSNLFNKYKTILTQEDLIRIMKESYRID